MDIFNQLLILSHFDILQFEFFTSTKLSIKEFPNTKFLLLLIKYIRLSII